MFDNIVDMIGILLPGLAVLAAIAWVIGRVDADARKGAWQRIAAARHELHDHERDPMKGRAGHRCPDCPARRYLPDDRD